MFVPQLSGRQPHKATQTDLEFPPLSLASTPSSSTPSGGKCNCEAKYNKAFTDYKGSLERDAKADKDRALKELEERVGGWDVQGKLWILA